MPPIQHPTSSKEFAKLLHTDKNGTWSSEIEKVWDRLYPDHPLAMVIEYRDGVLHGDSAFLVEFGHPNLWIGHHEQGDHCCLMYIRPHDLVLSHSQFISGTTSYFMEVKPLFWMTNSYAVYVVK